MHLQFYGAAGEVTGSCHLLEFGKQKVLLDIGMIQGGHEESARNSEDFSFDPRALDAVLRRDLPFWLRRVDSDDARARLERFMQLSADNNMQVVQPTSASQIFHLLRRQMVRQFRKPLIIFTPKSLLRNKDATSPLSDFTRGEFKTVIGEVNAEIVADKVKRVIACSGKVYYDLVKKRDEKGHDDVAIIRVEQLYPFPHKAFSAEIKRFPNAVDLVWCQDEPQNQGAWFFVQHYIHENMLDGQKLGYSGRAASASPAVGYSHLHQEQQKALVDGAFAKLKGFVLTK